MKKFSKILRIVLAVIILTVFLFIFWAYITQIQKGDLAKMGSERYAKEELKKDSLVEDYDKAIVDYVIDGDTIVLASGEKVRYIGIDTPELGKPGQQDDECLALEAKVRNQQLLEEGGLKLIKDSGADKDKYGRLLRYVYSGDIFINKQLALEGLAETFFCKPSWKNCPVMLDETRKNRIQFASDSAKQNSRGLFSEICK